MFKSRILITIIFIIQILFLVGLIYFTIQGYSNYELATSGPTSIKGFLIDWVGAKWFIWPITAFLSIAGLFIRRFVGWLLTSHLFFLMIISTIFIHLNDFVEDGNIDRFQIVLMTLVFILIIVILNLSQVLDYFQVSKKSRIWLNLIGIVVAQVLILGYVRIGLWQQII